MRQIDLAPFSGRFDGVMAGDPGPLPRLDWIDVARLRIDPRYQRHILRAGEKNIIAIARKFEWSKFAVVIVAPIAGGLFAIIDGQHRATGAALRGMKKVPCLIVEADLRQQADAFVAVNGNVTAMSSLQLHAARVAAGDPAALALNEVCAAADVAICRYPVPANKMKPGETLAVGVLRELLAKYGRDVLVAALKCITRTRQGNVGMIRAQIVEALCVVLEAEPGWRAADAALIRAMQFFDFAVEFNAARAVAITEGGTVCSQLIDRVCAHLEQRMEAA